MMMQGKFPAVIPRGRSPRGISACGTGQAPLAEWFQAIEAEIATSCRVPVGRDTPRNARRPSVISRGLSPRGILASSCRWGRRAREPAQARSRVRAIGAHDARRQPRVLHAMPSAKLCKCSQDGLGVRCQLGPLLVALYSVM